MCLCCGGRRRAAAAAGGGGGDGHFTLGSLSLLIRLKVKTACGRSALYECSSTAGLTHLTTCHIQHTQTFSSWISELPPPLNLPSCQQLVPCEEMTVTDTGMWHYLLQSLFILRGVSFKSLSCGSTAKFLFFFLLPECNKSSSTMPRREMSGVYFWYLWPYKIMPSEQKHPLSCSQRDQEYFLIISLEQFIFEDTV